MSQSRPSPGSAANLPEKFSLKDHLFNRDRVAYLAGLFQQSNPAFDASSFVRQTMESLSKLELKQRISHIASTLEGYLSRDFRVAAKQIVAALPPPLDPTKSDDDFGDFIFAPLGEFVVRNGLSKDHLRLSLQTLKQLTQRFSMEDAIRYFLNKFPQETLAELQQWATDKNYHVRRLVSEGTRPSLPWSARLALDPLEPLPLLETLHADPTRYVTRSVANHLNDLAKRHPEQVLKVLASWRATEKQQPTELRWMSQHALRTLIKQGHAGSLEFLGFRPRPPIQVNQFRMHTPTLRPGEAFEFDLELTAEFAAKLVLDYVLDSAKAGGRRSRKVFKLKQVELAKGQSLAIRKRHVLRANATTYRLYPGPHHVTLQINGQPFGTTTFELVVPSNE